MFFLCKSKTKNFIEAGDIPSVHFQLEESLANCKEKMYKTR